VIISTLRAQHDVDRGMALGADAYLPKPFTPEQLRAACTKLLDRAAPAAAPTAPAKPPTGGPA
jgi:two-component system chemotaxis response regulator CheY